MKKDWTLDIAEFTFPKPVGETMQSALRMASHALNIHPEEQLEQMCDQVEPFFKQITETLDKLRVEEQKCPSVMGYAVLVNMMALIDALAEAVILEDALVRMKLLADSVHSQPKEKEN